MRTLAPLAGICALSATLFALSPRTEAAKMDPFRISSPAFPHNGSIPARHTCDGPDLSPPLRIEGVPPGAKSLALIVDDPDAPGGTWVHWIVWNIDPATREIPENRLPGGAVQGRNGFGTEKYGGPCPPSGTHRYFFRLYALDAPLALARGADKARLESAMKGHVLGQAEFVGLYARQRGR